jgi:hypothetical protein
MVLGDQKMPVLGKKGGPFLARSYKAHLSEMILLFGNGGFLLASMEKVQVLLSLNGIDFAVLICVLHNENVSTSIPFQCSPQLLS